MLKQPFNAYRLSCQKATHLPHVIQSRVLVRLVPNLLLPLHQNFLTGKNQIEKRQKVASLKAQLPFMEERNKLDAKAKRLSVEMEIAGLEAGIQASREAEVELTDLEETLSLLPIESQKGQATAYSLVNREQACFSYQ